MNDTVSVLKCAGYEPAGLDAVVERHFAALEKEGPLVRPGMRVVLKPNLVLRRSPEDASTTHPEFMAAVIRAVQRRGGVCTIAESPGGPYTAAALRSVYAGTGMERVANETGAALNYDTSSAETPSRGGRLCAGFRLIAPVLQADLVISVAKLKTHAMMSYSGAVKNLFGCVPGLMKPEFHFRFPAKEHFAEMIVDLCETVRPGLSLIDGIYGMEGDGPTGGTPRFVGATLASRNPHALDLVGGMLVGYEPEEIPTVKAAIARGLCPGSVRELTLVGDDIGPLRVTDYQKPRSRSLDFLAKLPAAVRGPLTGLLTSRPVIRRSTCIGCGKCAESCPRHAIEIREKKARIDYQKCIRCYCCHEMCPVKSIDIKRLGLFWR